MTKVAIVDEEGQVLQMYTSGHNVHPEGPWDADNSKTVVHLQNSDDTETYKNLRYYKDGVWKVREACPSSYHRWKDEAWSLDSEELWKHIRETRDLRLWMTDWTQASDAPLTDEQKTDWASYRAGLRAVPEDNADVTALEDVIWPTQPS